MRVILGLAVSVLALGGCSYSSHGPAENRSVERSGMIAAGDVDATGSADYAGMIVDADGDIGRNLDLAGASVSSSARVGGNLSASGARVRFTGSVAGNTEVEAATAHLGGRYEGDLTAMGARIVIEGDVGGRLRAQGAYIRLAGRFTEPVDVIGTGNQRRGRAIISGRIEAGGQVCASRVEIRDTARISGPLTIIADARPDVTDTDFAFVDLAGRDCDRI